MAVGGNQAATEYFSKNMTTGSSKDAKAKYTSRAGQQYKKLLEKRAADDAIAYVFSFLSTFEESHLLIGSFRIIVIRILW